MSHLEIVSPAGCAAVGEGLSGSEARPRQILRRIAAALVARQPRRDERPDPGAPIRTAIDPRDIYLA